MNQIIDIYTDGSFTNKTVRWGFIAVLDNKEIYRDSGVIDDEEIVTGYQIGGEAEAVIKGIEFCKTFGYRGRFYVDYSGLIEWVGDWFGNGKAWQTNKSYTRRYRDFVLENRDFIVDFVKVKSHTGDYWNEKVDELVAISTKNPTIIK